MTQGNCLRRCPLCSGELYISEDATVSHDHWITRQGRISKKYTVLELDEQDHYIAWCCDCSAYWDEGDFYIEGGRFYDCKYTGTVLPLSPPAENELKERNIRAVNSYFRE